MQEKNINSVQKIENLKEKTSRFSHLRAYSQKDVKIMYQNILT